MKIVFLCLRLLVAGVFLYAAIVKLGASERLTITVAQIALLPEGWARPFAIALPWAEMTAAILLLVPRTARLGAIAAAALLFVFLAGLTWAYSQGLAVDCGCFGGEDSSVATSGQIVFAIARDAVLLAITLLLAARRSR